MPNLIIAFPKKEDCLKLRNLLIRSGWQVSAICTSGVGVLQAADRMTEGIILCGYRLTDMTCIRLREDLEPDFMLLLLASEALSGAALPAGVIHVPMPVKTQELLTALEDTAQMMLRSGAGKGTHRRSRAMNRQIEKAKALLMERNGMTEDEAHRYLQKTSMDTGTNMAETAQMLLDLMGED